MTANPNFCNHLLYLAGYDYENYVPVYESEFFLNKQRMTGDEQFTFDFCPLCGTRLDILPEDS